MKYLKRSIIIFGKQTEWQSSLHALETVVLINKMFVLDVEEQ